MAENEIHTCAQMTHPGSMHVDPEPAEYCETEVENEGDLCPAHGGIEPDWDQIRKDKIEERINEY